MKVPSIRAPADAPPSVEPPPQSPSPTEPPPSVPPARSPIKYLKQVWRAEMPLKRVFWQDMMIVGTAVNLAAMGLAFVAVALGASTPAGIAIHLSPVPYNIFLTTAVWRRADVEPADWAWLARIGALVWLLLAFVV